MQPSSMPKLSESNNPTIPNILSGDQTGNPSTSTMDKSTSAADKLGANKDTNAIPQSVRHSSLPVPHSVQVD
jgi:hypothetical protein